MTGVQLLIVVAAVASGVVAWRAGHLVGAGMLCVLECRPGDPERTAMLAAVP